MATHEIRIDRSKTLLEEPTTGHNRWHPDIAPVVRCEPGDEVVLETRDAFDGQMGPQATLDVVAAPNLDVVHPLTGPVYVDGCAARGPAGGRDPRRVAGQLRLHRAGAGLWFSARRLPRTVHGPVAHRRRLGDLRRPARAAHPGLAVHGHHRPVPGHEALRRITAREQAALDRGGFVLPPSVGSAVPSDARIAAEALRTIPPREQAGNVDIKQLTAGTRLFIPVDTPGALFSAGDAHFAQGDCETCGTAIEMSATCVSGSPSTAGRRGSRHPGPAVLPYRLLGRARVRRPARLLRDDRHVGRAATDRCARRTPRWRRGTRS